MLLNILPLASEPGGAKAAQQEFDSILNNRFLVVEVVFGPAGAPFDAIIEVATVAAREDPSRCVVWCREPKILRKDQKDEYLTDPPMAAVFSRFGQKITARLSVDDAQLTDVVLDAFATT